jgi:hypothetical protein
MLRIKCVWHRCYVAPWKWVSIAISWALVIIRNDQVHSLEAARLQPAEELRPGGLRNGSTPSISPKISRYPSRLIGGNEHA